MFHYFVCAAPITIPIHGKKASVIKVATVTCYKNIFSLLKLLLHNAKPSSSNRMAIEFKNCPIITIVTLVFCVPETILMQHYVHHFYTVRGVQALKRDIHMASPGWPTPLLYCFTTMLGNAVCVGQRQMFHQSG